MKKTGKAPKETVAQQAIREGWIALPGQEGSEPEYSIYSLPLKAREKLDLAALDAVIEEIKEKRRAGTWVSSRPPYLVKIGTIKVNIYSSPPIHSPFDAGFEGVLSELQMDLGSTSVRVLKNKLIIERDGIGEHFRRAGFFGEGPTE